MGDGAPTDSAADSSGGAGEGPACPLCGAGLYRRHCEYVCPNHGAVMDCSDTFWTR